MDEGVPLWAHSRNAAGLRHRLEDHARSTAALAAEFGAPFGAGELAGYLGLVHDVGKAACLWQQRLLTVEGQPGRRVGTDHKTAGAWLANQQASGFALVVLGHHGSIPAVGALKGALTLEPGRLAEVEEAIGRARRVLPEIDPAGPIPWPAWYAQARQADPCVADLLLRMVASAVFDADFLDTQQHFDGAAPARPFSPLSELAARFETARARYLGARKPTPVDEVREELAHYALEAADGPVGVYRLAAPTGAGKTIAAARFALHHGRLRGLRHVIVAVPYISITQQTATVYRELLEVPGGDPVVLEHHSGLEVDAHAPELRRWQRLAADNWDAPFVVTTTVQLFHSLFSNRPGAMRKLHRLARAVLVLDEVQALPDRLLLPILAALRCLADWFGTTVLLASATQPEFWSLSPFKGLACRDVVPEPTRLYQALRRVRYEWRPGRTAPPGDAADRKPTLAEIAEEAATEHQVLVVVNTTADAAAVHQRLKQVRPPWLGPVLHLSTRMAAQHRHDVLAQITRCLAAGAPVAVASTQVVEAGVDLDFPVVYRALAPADSLQQAAGRANRHGLRPEGRVVVFEPADGGQPRDQAYKTALTSTRLHFGPGKADPDDPDALAAYYRERYDLQALDASSDGARVQRARRTLDFPKAAAGFDFFAEPVWPVLVPYRNERGGAAVGPIVARLRAGEPVSREDWRALQPYLATLPAGGARRALADGRATPVIGELIEWHGHYDQDRGIVLNDPPEASVW